MNNKDFVKEITGSNKEFPRYTSTFINYANRWSSGTSPDIVGQMSELVPRCPSNSHKDWENWYLENYPNSEEAIEKAVELIYSKLIEMLNALEKIDKNLVKDWVEDFIFIKTFYGIKFQEAIIKKVAEKKGMKWRLATPEEESKNIDGFIGDKPISIKPETYLSKMSSVREIITVELIYYKKTDKYLYIYTAN